MTAPPDHPPSRPDHPPGRRDDADNQLRDFVRLAWPRLLGTAWLLCGDRHEAEDLVQTALLKVTVNNKTVPSTTEDGLGWLEVKPEDEVQITGHRPVNGGAQVMLVGTDAEPVATGSSPLNLGRR